MLVRAAISVLAIGFASNALAQASAAGTPSSNAMADAVWFYIADTCPVATTADTSIHLVLQGMLDSSFEDDASPLRTLLEVRGRNVAAQSMSDLDKRVMGIVLMGAYGLSELLKYMNAVNDETLMAKPGYLASEAAMLRSADVSLQLMECLWPSADEVLEPRMSSGWGAHGQQMWIEVAKSVYAANCKIDFLTLARSYVEADFVAVPPADRKEFVAGLMKQHEDYLEAEEIAEKCEDFS
ncbi:hypothetical protein [Yoonia sp. SDW83-1]|uniref:hypothetical protein n=1 Tax=Yoonia sp. SDW83-1 TaxID=3366945 RepID=UPI00398C60DC